MNYTTIVSLVLTAIPAIVIVQIILLYIILLGLALLSVILTKNCKECECNVYDAWSFTYAL